jgi:hypothetical protein
VVGWRSGGRLPCSDKVEIKMPSLCRFSVPVLLRPKISVSLMGPRSTRCAPRAAKSVSAFGDDRLTPARSACSWQPSAGLVALARPERRGCESPSFDSKLSQAPLAPAGGHALASRPGLVLWLPLARARSAEAPIGAERATRRDPHQPRSPCSATPARGSAPLARCLWQGLTRAALCD